MYARQFWPTFKKRRWGLTFAIGRSFFDGPEALARWSFDSISPFERHRTLDPGADPKLVQLGLTRLGEHYPALPTSRSRIRGAASSIRRPTASR